jgi:hypothetical protein
MSEELEKQNFTVTIPAGTIISRAGNTRNNRKEILWKYYSYWRTSSSEDDTVGVGDIHIPPAANQAAAFKNNFIKNYSAFASRIAVETEGVFEFWRLKKDIELLYIPYTALTYDVDEYAESVTQYLLQEVEKISGDAASDTSLFRVHVKPDIVMTPDKIKNCYKYIAQKLIAMKNDSEIVERCAETSGRGIAEDYALVKISLLCGFPGIVRVAAAEFTNEKQDMTDEIAIGIDFIDEYAEMLDISGGVLRKILSEELCDILERINKSHIAPPEIILKSGEVDKAVDKVEIVEGAGMGIEDFEDVVKEKLDVEEGVKEEIVEGDKGDVDKEIQSAGSRYKRFYLKSKKDYVTIKQF